MDGKKCNPLHLDKVLHRFLYLLPIIAAATVILLERPARTPTQKPAAANVKASSVQLNGDPSSSIDHLSDDERARVLRGDPPEDAKTVVSEERS